MTVYSDRSRLIAYQVCPRARYLGYGWGGTGLQRNRIAIPLMTGIVVHTGRAHMLSQVAALGDVPRPDLKVNVDAAVKAALDEYDEELKLRGLDVELGEDAQAVVDEQKALTEGLLRAYAKAGLPRLLEQYRVLEVEHEDVWPDFTRAFVARHATTGEPVDFQARADALLQELSTGDLYIDSLKTAATFDHRKDDENRHDVQGLSEAAVVERRLQAWWTTLQGTTRLPGPWTAEHGCTMQTWNALTDMASPPRIMGIQMTFLVKGKRDQAYDGAPYRTRSPLLNGYYREGITEREFAWKAETPCPGPGHVLKQGKKGPIVCEGKKFHKLGVDWTSFSTYSDAPSDGNEAGRPVSSIAEWVDMMAAGVMQPEAGDPFEAIIQMPLPYFRQDADVASWIRQAQAQESEVASKVATAESIRVDDPANFAEQLDGLFIQHKRSCDYPSKCQFQEICFGDPSQLINPFSTGLYQRRIAHHQPELDAAKIVVDK